MNRIVKALGVLAASTVLLGGAAQAAPIQATVGTGEVKFNSGNSSERLAALPVTKYPALAPRVIYCVALPSAPQAGDVVEAFADFEITTPYPYNLLLASQIILTDSCTNTQGLEITEGAGYNCLPALHHCLVHRGGSLILTSDTYRRFVAVVAWSSTMNTAWRSGHALVVERDYGRLHGTWTR
jgi:hypothetical protein